MQNGLRLMNSASQVTVPGGSGVLVSDSFQGSYPVQPRWSDARSQTARFTLGKSRKSICDPTVDSLPPHRGTRLRPAAPRQRQGAYASEEPSTAVERAVALAPDFADGHVALGWYVLVLGYFDFQGAAREIERAMSLAPGSAYVLRTYASFQGLVLGLRDTPVVAMRRAVSLDPQNYFYRLDLLAILRASRLFSDVLTEAPGAAAALRPGAHNVAPREADAFLAMGKPQRALQLCESQSTPIDEDDRHSCLALAYQALGKIHESEIEFARLHALKGESEPTEYAAIYAQLGKPADALRWLGTAERLREQGLVFLKTDWRLDPIREQGEFKALERRLNYPP
jgi:tetratricopeptide (TPR) repeat protein